MDPEGRDRKRLNIKITTLIIPDGIDKLAHIVKINERILQPSH